MDTKKIIVKVDNWKTSSKYPQGHFVSVIGEIGDPYTEGNVILLEHNVEIKNFSKLVMDCLPPEGVIIKTVTSFLIKIRKIGKSLKKNMQREKISETIMFAVSILLDVKISMMLFIADCYLMEITR